MLLLAHAKSFPGLMYLVTARYHLLMIPSLICSFPPANKSENQTEQQFTPLRYILYQFRLLQLSFFAYSIACEDLHSKAQILPWNPI
jgi:uncharacterized protein YggT (Ycf19 family)